MLFSDKETIRTIGIILTMLGAVVFVFASLAAGFCWPALVVFAIGVGLLVYSTRIR